MNHRIKRIVNKIRRTLIKPLEFIDGNLYTKHMTKYLKDNGMNIKGDPFYLSSEIYFDGSDYSLITLEKGCSISREVMLLTHDLSMNTVYKGINLKNKDELDKWYDYNRMKRLKPIRIGAHSFIGARSFILPGSDIGCNCLIGGAVLFAVKYRITQL